MRIAVASDGKLVSGHFGHCEGFHVFETDGKRILEGKMVPNPGHRPGFLPKYLNEMGINVIISGGMGGGAIDIFQEKGIQVVTGATGEALLAAERFLEGSLAPGASVCQQHQHHEECGGH